MLIRLTQSTFDHRYSYVKKKLTSLIEIHMFSMNALCFSVGCASLEFESIQPHIYHLPDNVRYSVSTNN
jgi:hypothetical protein